MLEEQRHDLRQPAPEHNHKGENDQQADISLGFFL
jgi:hypothetical protein